MEEEVVGCLMVQIGGWGGGGDSIAASLAIAKLVEETSFCVRVGAV